MPRSRRNKQQSGSFGSRVESASRSANSGAGGGQEGSARIDAGNGVHGHCDGDYVSTHSGTPTVCASESPHAGVGAGCGRESGAKIRADKGVRDESVGCHTGALAAQEPPPSVVGAGCGQECGERIEAGNDVKGGCIDRHFGSLAAPERPIDFLEAINARVKQRYCELQQSSYVTSYELLRVAEDEKKKIESHCGRMLPLVLDRDCETLHAVQTLERQVNFILRCALVTDPLLLSPMELEQVVLQHLKNSPDMKAFKNCKDFAEVGLGQLAHSPLVRSRFTHPPKNAVAVYVSAQDLLQSLHKLLPDTTKKNERNWEYVLKHIAMSRGVPREVLSVPLGMPSHRQCVAFVIKARAVAKKNLRPDVLAKKLFFKDIVKPSPANWPAMLSLNVTFVQSVVAAALFPWTKTGCHPATSSTTTAMRKLQSSLGSKVIVQKLLTLRGQSSLEAAITAVNDMASTIIDSLLVDMTTAQDAWMFMGRFGVCLLACLVNSIADTYTSLAIANINTLPLSSSDPQSVPTAPLPSSTVLPLEHVVEAIVSGCGAAALEAAESNHVMSSESLPSSLQTQLCSAESPPAAAQAVAAWGPALASRIADDAIDELCRSPRVALLAALAQRVNAAASRASPTLPELDNISLEQLLQRDEMGKRVLAELDRDNLFVKNVPDGSGGRGYGDSADDSGGNIGVLPDTALGRELAELVQRACDATSASYDIVGVSTASRRLSAARAAVARHFALSEPADLNPLLADAAPDEQPKDIECRLARMTVSLEVAAVGAADAASASARKAVCVTFAALPGPPSQPASSLQACLGLPEPLVVLSTLVPMLGDVEVALAWPDVYAPAGYGARFGDFLRQHGASCTAAGLRFVEGARSRWYRLPLASSDDDFIRAVARRDAVSAAAAAAGLICTSAADHIIENAAAATGGGAYVRIHRILSALCSCEGVNATGNCGGVSDVSGVGGVGSGDYDAMLHFCIDVLTTLPPFLRSSLGGEVLLPVLLDDLQCGVQQLSQLALGDATKHAALLAAAGALGASDGARADARQTAQQLVLQLLAPAASLAGATAQFLPLVQRQQDAGDINSAFATLALTQSGGAAASVVAPTSAILPASELTADQEQLVLSASNGDRDAAKAFVGSLDLEELPPSLAAARTLVQFLERDYTDKPADDSARQAAEGATAKVAGEMYTLASHFLFELVQNADDASYLAGDVPELSFVVTGCGSGNACSGADSVAPLLRISTNERGFRVKDIRAITLSGKSSKGAAVADSSVTTAAPAQTGKKGIGFKSVFSVSRTPMVHSGYLHFVFDTLPPKLGGLGLLGMLAPRWMEPANAEVAFTRGSDILLPLQALGAEAREVAKFWPRSQQLVPAAKVDDAVRALAMQPDVMLFLRRLVRLRLSAGVGTDAAVENLMLERGVPTTLRLPADLEASGHDAALVSVRVTALQPKSYQWLVHSLNAALNSDGNGAGGVPPTTRLSLAFPVTADMFTQPPDDDSPVELLQLPEQRLFSYLPVRSMGWRVIIQADWNLVTSREALKDDDADNGALARGVLPKAFAGALESFKELAATLAITPQPSALVICRAFLAFAPLEQLSSLRRTDERLLIDAAAQTCLQLRKAPCLPAASSSAYLRPEAALRAPSAMALRTACLVPTVGGGSGMASLSHSTSPGTVLVELLATCGVTSEDIEAATGKSLVHPRLVLSEDRWASLAVRSWDLSLAAEVLRQVVNTAAAPPPPERFLAWSELLHESARANSAASQIKRTSTLLNGVPFVPLLGGQIVPLPVMQEPSEDGNNAIFFVASSAAAGRKLLDLVRVLGSAHLNLSVVDEPITIALQDIRWHWLQRFLLDLGMHELTRAAIVEHVVLPFFVAAGVNGATHTADIATRLAGCWAAVSDWYAEACGSVAANASAVLSRDDERLLTMLRRHAILLATDGAIVPVPSSSDETPPLGLPQTALVSEAASAAANLATALQDAGVLWRVADAAHWPVSDDSSRERVHALLTSLGLSEGFAGVPLRIISATRQASGASQGMRLQPTRLVPTAIYYSAHVYNPQHSLVRSSSEDTRTFADSPSLDKQLASLRERRSACDANSTGADADAALDAICTWLAQRMDTAATAADSPLGCLLRDTAWLPPLRRCAGAALLAPARAASAKPPSATPPALRSVVLAPTSGNLSLFGNLGVYATAAVLNICSGGVNLPTQQANAFAEWLDLVVEPDPMLVIKLLDDLSQSPQLPRDANAGNCGGNGSHVWLLSDVLDAPTTMPLSEVHVNFTPKAVPNKHDDGTLGPLRQPQLGDVHAVVAPKLVFAQYKLLATAAAAGGDELPVKDAHFFTPTLGWRSPLGIGEVLQVPGVFAPLMSGRLLFTDPVGGLLRYCGTSAADFMSDRPVKGSRGGLVIYPASGRVMDAIRQHAKIDVAWCRAMAHLERAAACVADHVEPDACEYDMTQYPPLALADLVVRRLAERGNEAEPLCRLLGERNTDLPLPLVLSRLVPISSLAPTVASPVQPAYVPTGPAARLSDTPTLVLLRTHDVAARTGTVKHQECPPGLVLLIDDEEGSTKELSAGSVSSNLDKMRERYTSQARKMLHVPAVLDLVCSFAVCHLQAATSTDENVWLREDRLRRNAAVAAFLMAMPAARATSLAQRPLLQPPTLSLPTTCGTEGGFGSWHNYAWAWTSTAVLDIVCSRLLNTRIITELVHNGGMRAALTSVIRQADGSGVAVVAPNDTLLAAFSLQRPADGGLVIVHEMSVSAQLVVRNTVGGEASVEEAIRGAENRRNLCLQRCGQLAGYDLVAEMQAHIELHQANSELASAQAALAASKGVLYVTAASLAGVSESPACWCVAAHDFVADRVASSPLVLQELGMQGQQKLLNRLGEVSRAVIAALDAERRAETLGYAADAPKGPRTVLRDELGVSAGEQWFSSAELERPRSTLDDAAAVAEAAAQADDAMLARIVEAAADADASDQAEEPHAAQLQLPSIAVDEHDHMLAPTTAGAAAQTDDAMLARIVEAAAAADASDQTGEPPAAPLQLPSDAVDAYDRMLAATVAVDNNRRVVVANALSSRTTKRRDSPVISSYPELPLPGVVQLPAKTLVHKRLARAARRLNKGVTLSGAIFVDTPNSGCIGSIGGSGGVGRGGNSDVGANNIVRLSDDTLGLGGIIAEALASPTYQHDAGDGRALASSPTDSSAGPEQVQRRQLEIPAGPLPALTLVRSTLATDSAMSAAIAALPAAAGVLEAAVAATAAPSAAGPGLPPSALAQATGRVGELLAYMELRAYVDVQQHANAFFGSGDARLPAADLVVEWVNEKDETGKPYDICLRCRKTGKHVLFIEVKSTRFDAAASAAAVQRFPVSMAEASFAHQQAARYQLWLAVGVQVVARLPRATIIKVDNPVAAINHSNLGLVLELAGGSELPQPNSRK